MNGKAVARGLLLIPAMLLTLAPPAAGQGRPGESYDETYRRFLWSARTLQPQDPASSIAWMGSLTSDPRARAVNDLVTVRVVESISASGTADSSLSKKNAGSASVGQFFGAEKKLPSFVDPAAGLSSDSKFEGGGSTVRTGELTATMTARVAEVLPNGDLVLEGAREIDINGDRQIVVLSGVVRTADIAPNNVVLSTRIGQLRIRYFGNGLIKDNLRPGWLIRILNKIF